MEISSIFRALMLFMANSNPDSPLTSDVNNISDSGSITAFASTSEPIVTDKQDPIEAQQPTTYGETTPNPTTALMPYDFDCSMPYPPSVLAQEQGSWEEPSHPSEEEKPHAKATFKIPIHIVHKLPDSALVDLHRFEDYCEDTIVDCYRAIREFNNYNYEKNQEIQYLSYTEKRKQEIIQQSQEKKAQIKTAFNKMHRVCVRAERQREKITTVLNPYLETYSQYFAQPKRTPKLWYDIHNLETIIQQLFTPKLHFHTLYDEKTHVLRMSRLPNDDSTRKEFLPLPDKYLTDRIDDEDVDGASIIMEYNHPDTTTAIGAEMKHADQFNRNVLEQYTYSTKVEIQQIIIYYVFKFFELKVQDGTRKVFHYTRLLKEKKSLDGCTKAEISDLEDRVCDAIKKLQANTIEMERNRVIPELIELYNAENEAKSLLPDTKLITQLIGPNNKRVITTFNPSNAILFHALDGEKKPDLITDEHANELTKVPEVNQSVRENLEEPLHWDQNWTWDY